MVDFPSWQAYDVTGVSHIAGNRRAHSRQEAWTWTSTRSLEQGWAWRHWSDSCPSCAAIVPDGVGFEDLFGLRIDLEVPRGVPEEEPVRWRPECLTPWRGPSTTPRSSANRRVREVDQRLIEA